MSVYVCNKHPRARFYVGTTPYRFVAGRFDTKEVVDKEEREKVEAQLAKLSGNVLGIVPEGDFLSAFKCVACDGRFPSQAALQGHLSKHKSVKDIEKESLREGSKDIPPGAPGE